MVLRSVVSSVIASVIGSALILFLGLILWFLSNMSPYYQIKFDEVGGTDYEKKKFDNVFFEKPIQPVYIFESDESQLIIEVLDMPMGYTNLAIGISPKGSWLELEGLVCAKEIELIPALYNILLENSFNIKTYVFNEFCLNQNSGNQYELNISGYNAFSELVFQSSLSYRIVKNGYVDGSVYP